MQAGSAVWSTSRLQAPGRTVSTARHASRRRLSMLVEMFIKGLMIDPVTNMPIVILRDSDNQRTLPIWVGPVEANAIALQIENVTPGRPMTHDLLRNALEGLGASVERV